MYDAVVVGGGMIGSAVALGLAKQGQSVAVVENNLPSAFEQNQPPDIRLSALSLHTVQLLDALGAWQHIELMRSQPYTELAVWESASSDANKTVFNAASIGVENLGHFVENRLTQLALHREIRTFDNVTWYSDAKIAAININTTADTSPNQVIFDDATNISGRWLIGADGGQSRVRSAANIGQTGWQYKQHALAIVVKLEQPSGSQTWQQFKPTGPVALLPMYDNYAALIWYHEAPKVKQLAGLSDISLKSAIINHFPPIHSDFKIITRASFPLARAHANQYVSCNTVLVGDAAHTINPLAGQGVNIGFKDVEALLTVFEKNQKPNTLDMQLGYEKNRKLQNLIMMTAMDAFYVTFSNDIKPLKWFRNTALRLADNAGSAKQRALKFALGL